MIPEIVRNGPNYFLNPGRKGRTPIGHVHLNQFIDFLHQQTELIHNETNRFQLLENYNTKLEAELETENIENRSSATKLEVNSGTGVCRSGINFYFKTSCRERDEVQSELDRRKIELEFARSELIASQTLNQQLHAQIGLLIY